MIILFSKLGSSLTLNVTKSGVFNTSLGRHLFVIFPVLCHAAYAVYFPHHFFHHLVHFYACLPHQYLLLIITLSLTSRSVELITVWSTVLQTPYTLVTYKLEDNPCVLLILILIWVSRLILPIHNITWLSSFILVFPSK